MDRDSSEVTVARVSTGAGRPPVGVRAGIRRDRARVEGPEALTGAPGRPVPLGKPGSAGPSRSCPGNGPGRPRAELWRGARRAAVGSAEAD